MPTPWQRDLEAAGKTFEAWLRRRLGDASELSLTPLTAPTSSGFSNETLLCDAAWREAGAPRRESLVVRIQPTGYQVFPEYDMARQFETMRLLGPTDVPVPRALWLDLGGGRRFRAHRRLRGRLRGRAAWCARARPRRRVHRPGARACGRCRGAKIRCAGG